MTSPFYDHHLERCRAISIGQGGSAGLTLELARTRVQHVVIDDDVVEAHNLAAQIWSRSEIGMRKVDALERRVRDINPDATFKAIPKRFEEVADLRALLFDPVGDWEAPERVLLGAFSDSLSSQIAISRAAGRYRVNLLAAQMYEHMRGAEILFTSDPAGEGERPQACPRCVLSHRYAFHEEGGSVNLTNDGAPAGGANPMLNGLKFFLLMMLLHQGTRHPRWDVIARVRNRNFIQISFDPRIERTLGIRTFKWGCAGPFLGEVVYLDCPVDPDCEDCGGKGVGG